jgi:hypothetical protein
MINENILEDAAKAAFVKAQSVYRGDHDHFPLKHTWETTTERIREGWRSIAYAALEAADTPPLGTQPEPRVSGRQMSRCHVCGSIAINGDAALCLTCSADADRGEVRYDPEKGWQRTPNPDSKA